MKLQDLGVKEVAALLFLAIPVILPPYLQYSQGIHATKTLGLIILFYLPIWFYLRHY